jgi:hypothetical protein
VLGFGLNFEKVFNTSTLYSHSNLESYMGTMNKMKKAITFLLVFLCVASLSFTFSPGAFSQTSNLQVKNYSGYTDPSTGNYMVVGEVQNVGPDTITGATLYGTLRSVSNTTETADIAGTYIFADHMFPNDTAPFSMMFTSDTSSTGNLNWVPLGVTVTFNPNIISTNDTLQDNYLHIAGSTSSVSTGSYVVTGFVLNAGTLYPQTLKVAAAFYDSTGKVIATGISESLTAYLAPHEVATFSVTPLYPTPEMLTAITGYTLNVVIRGTTTQPTPAPSVSASVSPSSSTSTSPSTSATPSQTSSSDGNFSISLRDLYAIIAAVVVILIIVALTFMLRRRRSRKIGN